MAVRGRKPQSNRQKRAKGETRPSRFNENVIDFPVVDKIPKPPAWVRFKAGKEMWKELAGLLMKQRVLQVVDLHALGHLCQLHGKIVDDYRRKLEPTAAELAQLRLLFSEFGLTPSSRSRVSRVDGKKKNAFSDHGKAPEAPAH